jgi:ABC-type Fe3+-hydroxamate transport system substrate-binding protein
VPLTDIRGVEFDAASPPQRVVSLVPSLTETLFALGCGGSVVGITDYCIFPPALELPRVGGTKNPDVEAVRALRPDLVHMNLEENLRRHAEEIETFAPVFVTEPKSVEDVARQFEQLGELHGATRAAARLVEALRNELAALPPRAFTFACPIWKDPWMWCGHDTYVSGLVTAAGGSNVLARRERYPKVALEEVLALRPDVVFLPDEPYAFASADADAIRRARVIGPFPGHLFTWHGVRTIEGLRFLRTAMAE